ncbi:MAG: CheR family methyltransferase [Chloroflexia bacterium]
MTETADLACEMDRQTFLELRARIEAYSGIFLDDSRCRSLSRLVARRMRARGVERWDAYLALLDAASGTQELAELLCEVVNNETAFFRNPRHFRALAEKVLPELDRARPASRPLRLWSAGCSTGQEPYSLAITVAETFGLPPRRPVEIWATDISPRALEVAREGLYRTRDLERVEVDYRKRYFRPEGDSFRVIPALRELVRFQEMNLVATPFPPGFQGMDVIFCRNVTIYFRIETCRRLMRALYDCLDEGGYLFIGFAETLWRVFDAFQRVEAGGAFFYRKGGTHAPREAAAASPAARSVPGGKSVERPLVLVQVGPSQVPPRASTPRAEEEPDAARAYYRRGLERLFDGAYDEALAAFETALRAEPNFVEALCGIAQVHANQGRYAQALEACRRALELDDLAEEAYLLRGLVRRQVGQLREAIEDLERAAYLNPSSPTAHFYLGDVLLAAGQSHRALQAFCRARQALRNYRDDALVDGVPAHLLREACGRHIQALEVGAANRFEAGTYG